MSNMLGRSKPYGCCLSHDSEDKGPKRRREKSEMRSEINRISIVMQRGCEDHDRQPNPYCFDCYEFHVK